MKQRVKNSLNGIPAAQLPPQFRTRLLKLGAMLDELGLLDEQSQEFYVDEQKLRKLLKEHFPPDFEDRHISALQALPGSKLMRLDASVARSRGRLKPVPWDTIASQPGLFKVQPGSAGVGNPSSPADIRRAVQQLDPTIPDAVFEPTFFCQRLKEAVVAGTPAQPANATRGVAPSVWDCVVNNLGFWAAVALVAVIAAACIALAAAIVVVGPVAASVGAAGAVVITVGGDLVGAAFWAVFWGWFSSLVGIAVGLSVITVIIACIINPSFRR